VGSFVVGSSHTPLLTTCMRRHACDATAGMHSSDDVVERAAASAFFLTFF
jgi:hypothetical protein